VPPAPGVAVPGGSAVASPPLPPVPPKEHLAATMAGNAVKIAAVAHGGAKAAEWHPRFFSLGFDVAAGKNRWKE